MMSGLLTLAVEELLVLMVATGMYHRWGFVRLALAHSSLLGPAQVHWLQDQLLLAQVALLDVVLEA